MWIIGLAIWALVMAATYQEAQNKGRDEMAWLILAFFFGIFALIGIYLAADYSKREV